MKISNLLSLSAGLLAGLVIGVTSTPRLSGEPAPQVDAVALAERAPQSAPDQAGAEPGLATIRLGGPNPLATIEVFASSPSFIVVRDGKEQLILETELEPGEERRVHAITPEPAEPPSQETPPYLEKRSSQWAWAPEAQ